jgi:hypothetical protein
MDCGCFSSLIFNLSAVGSLQIKGKATVVMSLGTSLFQAAEDGDVGAVNKLLNDGAAVNTADKVSYLRCCHSLL